MPCFLRPRLRIGPTLCTAIYWPKLVTRTVQNQAEGKSILPYKRKRYKNILQGHEYRK